MSYFPPTLTTYATTLTNATASGDTTICSFVIPANTWQDGEMVTIRMTALGKNNKGTTGTVSLKVNATGGSAATIATSSDWTDSALESKSASSIELMRTGSTISIMIPGVALLNTGGDGGWDSPTAQWVTNRALIRSPSGGVNTWTSVTPTAFTSDITISLIANLDATNATFYFKPQAATAIKTPIRVK